MVVKVVVLADEPHGAVGLRDSVLLLIYIWRGGESE